MPRDKENFLHLLRSSFPIIVVETHDEQRVTQILQASASGNVEFGPLYTWSAIKGLESSIGRATREWRLEDMEGTADTEPVKDTSSPEEALRYIKETIRSGVVLLPDFHAYLTNPSVLRMVKEIAQDHNVNPVTLVLVSHAFDVPPEIERLCAHFEISIPDEKRIRKLLADEVQLWRMRQENKKIQADMKTIDLLVRNMTGLTESDVRRLIKGAIYDDQAITHSDVEGVMQAKYRMISRGGALQFEYDTASFTDIAGFTSLKSWLDMRKPFFVAADDTGDIDVPKGMLLVGVQGCGKSLAAKAVAGAWGVPLLRMDFAALFNKYIGESERNVREALKSAEVLAPCVLWIDEIEKAVTGQNDDTGTSSRLLGTLLTWMAEKKSRVFIVATSNDIEKLPPEMVRKGRLDEIFFVDLPDANTRSAIFRLHIEKRGLNAEDFDYAALVAAAEGFSGAEIEQAVVSAIYRAHAEKGTMADEHLLTELAATRPLSVVRGEAIAALKSWAQDRTVSV